ncbi:MAG: tripartite tricarboxylate transporter substrate binding protein [Gammaproteobacteria bacterium]|jgi:putative tricarboxylic transport membrane protein|nr:tripartite tricarboxylate transporter substrate binding protein [Gammaproteobacteria bacterium]MBT5205285.1 tripartite tricarboxylate transporter substrate binding protein [Gammaproteobacteria bacterium]MBT5602603.1 tripartite tricarboxylate transporter substrate binding protein [Gammaproteobacteria bacterium]MBT6245799.1 tripartite tricarboxylate transporter substrate binding protein [Gammaproteobacteria bacterium]
MMPKLTSMMALGLSCLLALPLQCIAASAEAMTKIHFLIPAGPGGGWDGTARGIGTALKESGLVESLSYENLSGGGGGRAIAKLIETAHRQENTLLINSTPIIVRSLQGIFPQSFRDLVPIASVIADYSCFAVRKDSAFMTFKDLSSQFKQSPDSIIVAGGSVRGNTDHFIIARALQLAGGDPRAVNYLSYDGGGRAMAGLLSGEASVLSTGLSEAIQMQRGGLIRILAVTAPAPLIDEPALATLKSQGIDLEFANWRGFFAAKGLRQSQYNKMENTLDKLVDTPEFEKIRARNSWARLHQTGNQFYTFLEQQEIQITHLMNTVGYLRPKR